jgi:hypothetical protein
VLHSSSPSLQLSPLPADAYERAKINVEKCVVGVFEEWDESMQIIQKWFPWIKITDNRKKMFLYSNKETRETIREDLKKILEDVNMCDMQLYRDMEEIFEKEKLVLNMDPFTMEM